MKYFSTILFLIFSVNLSLSQCNDPSNISLATITETTAQINWLENGTATSWNVEIVLAGSVPTGNGILSNDLNYIFSNLLSGQSYDVYVQANCGNGSSSAWVGPFNFTTLNCIISIQGVEQQDACLEFCFYATGGQFGTYFDFNSNTLPTGWNASPFTVGTPCLTNMTDNSPYFWANTTDASGIRQVSTNPLDISLGGIIQFYMRYGADDPDPGCETSDLPEEGVTLQYSIDGGGTWIDINYWQPTNILTDPLYLWTQYTEIIPIPAQTNNTIFRWYQESNSGDEFDNWGLDNILVSANTNANYNWDLGDGTIATEPSPCHTYSTDGDYTVTLTLDSPNCNSSDSIVISAQDTTIPNVICQNIDLILDATGNAVITPANIDNGTTDNCGIQSMTLSQSTFSCSDLGNNMVVLTVTDIYNNVAFCNASVNVLPFYQAPVDLVISNITATTATISWTPLTSETSWTVEIGPAGFTPTGVGTVTSVIPFNATNLSESTLYDVYITPVSSLACNTNSMVGTFNTLCNTVSVPYIENIEGQTLGSAINISNCWSADNSIYQWNTNSGATPSVGTGPNNAAFGSQYFYAEATGANSGNVAILNSPVFDLTTSTNTFMHFYYHMYGASMGDLAIDVFDGTNWINDFFVISGQQQTDNSDSWKQEYINISAFETVNNFGVRFRAIRGSDFTSDIAIDEFVIESITCIQPNNLVVSNLTGDSATLNWTELGSATIWEIEAVQSGNTPTGSGTVVTTNPYVYNGLMENTSYDFYIRSICSNSDFSTWFGPITIITPCAVQAVPYLHTIENQPIGNANGISDCWEADSSNFEWKVNAGATASIGTGPSNAAVGNNYFYTEATGATTGNIAEIYSPFFDLTTSTNTRLKFYYHMFGPDMGTLNVDLFDGNNWNNSFLVFNGQQQTSTTDAWILSDVDISMFEITSNFRVRFRGIRGSGFTSDMAIDEFEILGNTCNDISFISCPSDMVITTNPNECYGIPNFSLPIVQDNCNSLNNTPTLVNGFNPNDEFPIGTTVVEYTATNSFGTVVTCSFNVTVTDPFTGTFLNSDQIINNNSIDLCNTDVATLFIDGGDLDGTETYVWSLNNVDLTETSNTLSNVNQSGTYNVTITLGTCTNSFNITINQYTTDASFSYTNIDCTTATLAISGSTGGQFSFNTSPNDSAQLNSNTGEIFNATPGETYSVTYNTSNGPCQSTFNETITLLALDNPEFNLISESLSCNTAKIKITGDQNGEFSFNPIPSDNATINSSTGEMTNLSPNSEYTVSYTTNIICSNSTSITFRTLENCLIPQGISPNNDGLNDNFDISWMNSKQLSIYNRNGMEVYIKNSYKDEWYGTDKSGNKLPTGTYYYVIELENKSPVAGWVYINR